MFWTVVGGVGVVLAVAGAFLLLDSGPPAPASTLTTSVAAAPRATPEQMAATLYNRVMMASEAGDAPEAQRLVPEALRAYRNLGRQDLDTRYHLGLLHLTALDLESARAERDAIAAESPTHLLGIMLSHTIALESSDDEAAAAATGLFLDAYDPETSSGRGEYLEHRVGLERFLERARATRP